MVALGFGAIYLAWRITSTMSATAWLLSAGTLLVEVVGYLAVAVLVWALWMPARERPSAAIEADVDVVIRCAGSALEPLRATILAARDLAPITVLDLDARPEVARLAREMGGAYIATDPDDIDGLLLAAQAISGSVMFLLEAGDVPRPDALDRLLPWLDEPTVAIVQGMVVSATTDSSEHGSGGRHDKEFERLALGPSLGARGVARFAGSAALIRTASIRDLDVEAGSTPMVEAELTAALFAAGWDIVAPAGDPVVAVAPISSPSRVESVRACEASGARAMLVGRYGAFRFNNLGVMQRLALVAHAVRPLGGIRRTLIVVLLLDALLSGVMPIHGTAMGFAALWLPWFVLAALGLWSLSGGSLRPGDRVRGSMRVLGASWRGAMAPNGRPDEAKHTLTGAFGLHHGAASAAAVGAIGVVVGLRAISDRFTHTLAPMSTNDRAVLLAASLWSLGGGLDALRLLARRAQARRATRVVASLPSTIGERGAMVVDLTPLGAGVLGEFDLEVGAHAALEMVLPTATGCVSATIPVVVRNVRTDFSGDERIGVEFGDVAAYEADALAEFCIVQPALETLGVAVVDVTAAQVRPVTVLDDRVLVPRRIGLRAAALVAVFGAMSSSLPTAADASGAPLVVVRGQVVASATELAPDSTTPDSTTPDSTTPDSIPATGANPAGTVVTAICATDSGADGSYGTSDDTYGTPVSDIVGSDGGYELGLDGAACWYSVAPPAGFMLVADSTQLESMDTPQAIDLSTHSVPRVEIVAGAATHAAPAVATIDDVVWADLNGDRIVDAGEPMLPGVSVTLFDRNDTVVESMTTGATGAFAFAAVPNGIYRLGVSNLPAGYSAGAAVTGPLGRTPSFEATASSDIDHAIGLVPIVAPAVISTSGVGASTKHVAAEAAPTRILERPQAMETTPRNSNRSTLPALLVVLLASIIGFSVVAGSLRPGRVEPVRLPAR
jgi:cellulose synthase (UDP-forming)